ncbi:MAG: hypothetical protein BWY07_02005 [Candidatus Hydrogenedentes bacterium ADurb.Bin170]|nr:MAG: hypothetical protein BWY07_02005 [Candidatus Hydrogenedentes bacterium ADurb.Bin170]
MKKNSQRAGKHQARPSQALTAEQIEARAFDYLAWQIYAEEAILPKPWESLSDGYKRSYRQRARKQIAQWIDDTGLILSGLSPLQVALQRISERFKASREAAPIIEVKPEGGQQ